MRLYKHQKEALEVLERDRRAALLMDTGTGKTITALSLLARRPETRCPAVVLTPVSVARTAWLDDASNFPELTLYIALGHRAKRHKTIREWSQSGCGGVLVTSYESFRVDWARAYEPLLQRGIVKTLLLDESTKVKTPGAIISNTVRRASKMVPRCHIMTGCVAPNSLHEVWGQFYCCDPKIFGPSFVAFRNKYFYQPSSWNQWLWVLKPATMFPPNGAEAELHRLIREHAFIVSKEECLDLPPQIFVTRTVQMRSKAKEIYREFKKDLVVRIKGGEIVGASALSEMMCLRIFTAGLAHVYFSKEDEYGEIKAYTDWFPIDDAKLKELRGIVDELGNRPVLVLGQFRKEILRTAEFLSDECGRRTAVIYGDTSEKRRAEIVRDFTHGDLEALVGHPAAMGHGLNLQSRCSDTVWMSLPYSYEQFKQACDRVYRNLQTRTVTHHILLAEGTIDEKIYGLLKSKRSATLRLVGEELGLDMEREGVR